MTRSVDFILNLAARKLTKNPGLAGQIEGVASGSARVFPTRDLSELRTAALAIAERAPELVVLCGGDGTFMAGVSALRDAYGTRTLPSFVLAPAGTVATVARNWQQRGSALDVARRIVSGKAVQSVKRPTLLVAERDGATRVGFTVGTGLVARFFDRYYAEGAGGHVTALKLVSRIFVGSLVGDEYARSVLEPLPCSLAVDEQLLPAEAYSLIVCSVLRDLGLHMLVTYRGGEDPARPHLVASSLKTRRLGPQAPRVLAGKPLRGPGSFDGLVGSFRVAFPGGAPGPYVLDGDMFHASELTVSAGPVISIATL